MNLNCHSCRTFVSRKRRGNHNNNNMISAAWHFNQLTERGKGSLILDFRFAGSVDVVESGVYGGSSSFV